MHCYIGGKGSGKTYSVVQNILIPAFKAGTPVHSNIPINNELVRKDFIFSDYSYYSDLTIEDIINCPSGVILIIDECQLLLPPTYTYNKIPENLLEFFSKSRHKVDKGRATNVVVISQSLEGICKPVRMLIDTLYICKKMSNLAMSNNYLVKQYEVLQGVYDKNQLLNTYRGKYKKNIFKYYLSNSQNQDNSNEFINIAEKLVKDRTIFSNKLVIFSLFSLFALPLLLVFIYNIYFNIDTNSEKKIKIKDQKLDFPSGSAKFIKLIKLKTYLNYRKEFKSKFLPI